MCLCLESCGEHVSGGPSFQRIREVVGQRARDFESHISAYQLCDLVTQVSVWPSRSLSHSFFNWKMRLIRAPDSWDYFEDQIQWCMWELVLGVPITAQRSKRMVRFFLNVISFIFECKHLTLLSESSRVFCMEGLMSRREKDHSAFISVSTGMKHPGSHILFPNILTLYCFLKI